MNETDDNTVAAAIDSGPVSRPDVSEPAKLDSLGRSMSKPRGRKPLPRDADGRIIHPDGTLGGKRPASAVTGARASKAVAQMDLSDDAVGKAFGGVFSLASLPGGSHWRLFRTEEIAFGEVYGPLFRMLGPEDSAKVMKVFAALAVAPVTVTAIMPRLAVQKIIMENPEEKKQARSHLLRIKAFMAAEGELDVESQVAETGELLRQTVRNAAQFAADAKAAEVAATIGSGANGKPVS